MSELVKWWSSCVVCWPLMTESSLPSLPHVKWKRNLAAFRSWVFSAASTKHQINRSTHNSKIPIKNLLNSGRAAKAFSKQQQANTKNISQHQQQIINKSQNLLNVSATEEETAVVSFVWNATVPSPTGNVLSRSVCTCWPFSVSSPVSLPSSSSSFTEFPSTAMPSTLIRQL